MDNLFFSWALEATARKYYFFSVKSTFYWRAAIPAVNVQGVWKVSKHGENYFFFHKTCFIWAPSHWQHVLVDLSHPWLTPCNTSGFTRLYASLMGSFMLSIFCIFTRYTMNFKCPRKYTSSEVRSGDVTGQYTGQQRPIQRPGNYRSNQWRTQINLYAWKSFNHLVYKLWNCWLEVIQCNGIRASFENLPLIK